MAEHVKTSKPGRPLGHKLSEVTKHKIRLKRVGTHHSQATRDKISISLSAYFKKRGSLADAMGKEYSSVSKEAFTWVYDNRQSINDFGSAVMSEKKLATLNQLELLLGDDIELMFGHNATPEFLMIIKEELQNEGKTELLKELNCLI